MTNSQLTADALCAFEEVLTNPQISGSFGNYLYYVKSGRRVVLNPYPPDKGSFFVPERTVFVSNDNNLYDRRPSTWEALRALLAEDWILGTDRHPGVKIWYAISRKNSTRPPKEILVFKK